MPLLEVQDLTVEFPTRRGMLRALDRVSFASSPARCWAWSAKAVPANR